MGIAVVVIANDFSAINVALPTIEGDFHTNINTIQWVINAYALTFGVMIVTGGCLADMFGRRRAFFLGTAIFASMSALGGAAQTETWLIGSRVAMGIGGALMWPRILGMTFELPPSEKAGLAGGCAWVDPKTIAMLSLAAILVGSFVRIERRAGMNALIPRAVMSNESFRASCVAITLMSATFFSALLYLPQFMQKHLGYSPL